MLRKAAGAAAALLAAGIGLPLLTVALVYAIVRVLGGEPRAALAAIWAGSLGSPPSVTESFIKTAPLVFTGLGVAVAFRCGIWNIGAEGQFLAGMLGSTAAALFLPPLPPPLAASLSLAAGALAGALWAALPAFLRLKRGVPEVISTIMLNFLAVYLIEYLVRGPMRDPKSVSDWSPLVPDRAQLPRLQAFGLSGPYGRIHLGVILALLTVPLLGLWLSRSRAGFQIRAVGLNPDAARSAGIPVGRTVALAFLASGFLSGLGGGCELLGLIQRLYRYSPGSPGYGFSGIAVALLGQLHPAGALAAAFFFGALSAGCNQMQRSAGVSFHVAYAIQAAVMLLLVSLPRGAVSQRLRGLLKGGGDAGKPVK